MCSSEEGHGKVFLMSRCLGCGRHLPDFCCKLGGSRVQKTGSDDHSVRAEIMSSFRSFESGSVTTFAEFHRAARPFVIPID
uniref:Uncharacterized protein n=1 Tax=Plectus sambesii TaxID=2011161 RepID=A0A914VDX6_9BILA